jgi:ATP-binding cassette subfamily C (CFTR/MRP) protein 1
MYNEADIYIFDDPLSALDAHVGKHVFQGVISQLVQEGKTVVLVTNQLQFVNHADKIVFLKHDKVSQEAWVHKQGSYSELMQNDDFAELMKDVGAGDDEAIERSPKAADEASSDDKDQGSKKASGAAPVESPKAGSGKPGGSLTTSEEREQGAVSWDVYRGYLKLAKATGFFIGVVILCWSAQLAQVWNDWWLTWWTQQKFPELSDFAYNSIYLLGAVGFSLFTFTNGIFWAQIGMLTAKNIHARLLQAVLAGRMSFFDTTPVGRMISRFAKDMQSVDDNIPMQFDMCVRVVVILVLNFCVIGYITPAFMVVVAPIMVLYWYVQKVYKLAALQYKRLDSTTRSPIYNQFSESLGGLSTIRAYAVEPVCEDKNSDIVNTNTRTQFTQRMVERWLSVRLECIGNVVVGVAGLLGVSSAGTGTYAGFIGISLVYGMRVTGMLNWAVRSTTELATQMNCVERILHYVKTVEPEEKENSIEPPVGWPHAGVVEFKKYSMRYRPGLDLVLKEVDCVVEAGEKVGICGRTGSGKSSLMLALFRMVEPASGSIVIDGVDISTISLKALRSQISIIPQDPVLFSGTVSFNIDPTQNSTDNEIWEALDKVHLGDKVRSLDGGLGATVSEYGDMFSTGQRQLVCVSNLP